MSAKKDREKRREERLQRQDEAAENERRQRVIKIASAAGFLAIVLIAVLVVVSQSQTSGGDSSLEATSEVTSSLSGLQQDGLYLGEPEAPVTLVEFGDLQCPICRDFAVNVLPDLIDSKVRSGEARLLFQNFPILGDESVAAAKAAIAAAAQNRAWDYIELFYRNQGIEHTGYITDDFMTSIAEGAGIGDINRWDRERAEPRAASEVGASTRKAERLGFGGTPSFAVKGPGTKGLEPLGTLGTLEEFEAAIEAAS